MPSRRTKRAKDPRDKAAPALLHFARRRVLVPDATDVQYARCTKRAAVVSSFAFAG
jgi:hypothetical protein